MSTLKKKATIISSVVHSSRIVGSSILDNKVLLSKAAVVIVSAVLVYYSDLALIFGNALEFTTGNISNYVITIPFLSAIIIYRKRNILKAAATLSKGSNSSRIRLDDVLGITLCAIAIIFYIASTSTLYSLEFHILSMPIFLAGSTMLVFNLATLRHSLIAILLTFYLQPPPGEIVSELAADLSWTSAVLVQGLLGSLGLPVSLDSSLGAPALVIEGLDKLKTPFFVGEPSSGVFSTLGLSLFAVFVAYIIRGPTWKRLLLFASGFPLFYLLNVLRIALVLSIWYFWGKDASEVYHTISGSSMVAIGTLIILLMAEKALKLNIRSRARLSSKCDMCSKCLTARETMCLSCGRLLGRIKHSFGKSIERMAVVIFIALITTSIVVTSTYSGNVSKKLTDLDIEKIKGPETTEYLLPQVSGWDLKYAYRDSRVESILNQDAALAFRYLQTSPESPKAGLNSGTTPSLYSSVQISTGHHVWEDSLVTYPSRVGRPGATLLDSEDITISGEKEGRFLLFKRLESTSTEAVVYWFERTPLKFGSNFENRNVLISIWANTDMLTRTGIIGGPADTASIKNLYLSLAKPIAAYWDEQSATLSTSNELLFGFVNKNVYSLMVIVCIPLALFWLYHEIKKRHFSSRMNLLYHQLAPEDKRVVEALLHSQSRSKLCTGNSIAKSYAEISNRQLNSDQLTNLLRTVRRSGLITDRVTSVNDESLLVWGINFRVKKKEAREVLAAILQAFSKLLQLGAPKNSRINDELQTPTYIRLLKSIGIPGIVTGKLEKVDAELMELARLNKIVALLDSAANTNADHQEVSIRHELMLKTLNEVSSTFKDNGINYTIFKTIKPFPTTPSDIDVLLSEEDLAEAEALLMSSGYQKTAHDACSSTLEREMIVDLQVQPSVSNIPYLPKELLMENSVVRKINGFDVCTLNPEAELIVIASHCVYKEQMFTMNDYYAITMLAERVDLEQILYLASRANVLQALQIVVGICSEITKSVFNVHLKISDLDRIMGATHGPSIRAMPFKFPLLLVIKLLISRAYKDKEMRAKVLPAIIRFASPRQLVKLFTHIVRSTY